MEKYHGFDQLFYDYLFEKIVNDGGLRQQIIASELGKYHFIQSTNFRLSTLPKTPLIYIVNNTATSLKH